MKTASQTLYTIGKIINIIEIVFSALFIVLGIVALVMPDEIAKEGFKQAVTKFDSPAEVKAAGIGILVFAIIMLAVSLTIFILAKRATKALKDGDKKSNPHVVMLVIGIFGDIFYFLGGLFGILAANEQTNQKE